MSLSASPLITTAALSRSAAAFIFSLLAASTLGPESFGYFSVVWAFAAALLGFFAGVGTALVSKLVELRQHSHGEAHRLVNGMGTVLLATALLAFGTGFTAWQHGPPSHVPKELYVGVGAMVGLQLVAAFGCAALEGFGQLRKAVLLPLIGVTINVLGLLAVKALGYVLDLSTFLFICTTGLGSESAVTIWMALRTGALRPSVGRSWSGVRGLFAGGAALQASGLVGFLLDPLSKASLLGWLGPVAVTLFDLSMKIGWGLHSIFTAYTRLFLQIAPDDHAARIASIETSAKHVWGSSLLCSALILIWGTPLLTSLTGASHSLSSLVLLLALLAVLAMIWAAPAFFSLIGLRAYGFVLKNQLLLASGNLIGALALVPLVGISGVLWGLVTASLINAVLLWREFRSRVAVFQGFWALLRHRVWRITLCALMLMLAWLLHQLLQPSMTVLLVSSVPALLLLACEPPSSYLARRFVNGRL